MNKFLKGLVEMLAASAYSEVGDRGHERQEVIEANIALAPAQLDCQVVARA